jgi:hypothetical protein
MSDSEIRQLVEDYREHVISLDLLESRLLSLDISQETDLSRQLVGLLAEASHAHWSKDEIREELENTMRPFAFVFHIIPGEHLSNEDVFGMRSEDSPVELVYG